MARLPRFARRPLRQQGAITERKRPVRQVVYATVSRRARGRCELCGAAQDPLDPHHAFKRGHLGAIPAAYCETPELILGVCRRCHDAMDVQGVQALIDKARWVAVGRFFDRHELDTPETFDGDPLDVMRTLVRQVEEREEAART